MECSLIDSEAVCANILTTQAVLDRLRATVAALSADIAGWDRPAGSLAETIFHGQLVSCVGELLEVAQESVPHLTKLHAKFQATEPCSSTMNTNSTFMVIVGTVKKSMDTL
jgi:hypothetical protein